MRVFFDSSAFAKRYVRETGTDAVLAWCDRATEICLSAIALPEVISALCRLQREGKLIPQQYRQIKSLLLADVEDIAISDVTATVIQHTFNCLESNVLRGMDAIQVGSALALKVDVFVSAEARQCAAAANAGLTVDKIGVG